MGGGKKKIDQRIGEGGVNIQVGTIVICDCLSIQPAPASLPAIDDMDPISPEQLKDLSDTIVQIEMAEDDLLDAATIWQVLTRHLKGHGGGGDSGEENLARAQYWPARSYLVTWLSCRRGENMPRQAMVKQILRMWEICPGLKPSTYRLCSEHFQMSDLSTLNDVQLRAALWITLADWQRFWEARAGEGPCVAPDD